MELCQKVKVYVELTGFSVNALAKEAGVSTTPVYNLLKGHGNTTGKIADKIAKAISRRLPDLDDSKLFSPHLIKTSLLSKPTALQVYCYLKLTGDTLSPKKIAAFLGVNINDINLAISTLVDLDIIAINNDTVEFTL